MMHLTGEVKTCLLVVGLFCSIMPSSVEVKAFVSEAIQTRVLAVISCPASMSAQPYWRWTTNGSGWPRPSLLHRLKSTTVTTKPGTRRQSISWRTNLSNESRFGTTSSGIDVIRWHMTKTHITTVRLDVIAKTASAATDTLHAATRYSVPVDRK